MLEKKQKTQEKRRCRMRRGLYLLLLAICLLTSGCAAGYWNDKSEKTGQDSENESLDVWFFACSEDADSILLQTEDADILIDTGLSEDQEHLVEKLQELEVEDIELLILTHPDKDHIGGAVSVLENFPVRQVIQTDCDKGSKLQETVEEKLLDNPGREAVWLPQEKTELAFGELLLTIYPPKEAEYGNANNYSIAVLAEYEGKSFFFAGDAKKKRIGELLEEQLPTVDVYKVAYHGRDNGGSSELIGTLQPAYAVVTAQEAEKKTMQALLQTGACVYSTYEKDVHFSVKDAVLDVR